MSKKKRRNRDEIRDYLLSCACCPLCKETKSAVDQIVDGVMRKIGRPDAVKKPDHYCIPRKCIVNPDKPREQCRWRDEYYAKNGMRPMGMLNGIENER